jgi:hypothetical protein
LQALNYVTLFFLGAVIYTLVAVSIEQYCAVVHPLSLQTRRGSPLQQGIIRSIAVWICAAIIVIPIEVLFVVEFESSHSINSMYKNMI